MLASLNYCRIPSRRTWPYPKKSRAMVALKGISRGQRVGSLLILGGYLSHKSKALYVLRFVFSPNIFRPIF